MLDYAAIDAVAAVVREGSFEKAAVRLGVTRSAVSQRVRGLEERLGTVLVVRGQPCTATEAGERLCAHVERVRLLEGEMVEALPSLAGRATGDAALQPTLRIAVNADSLGAWLMPALAEFASHHSALLDLVVADEHNTAERLRSGEVLAAVTTDSLPVQGCRTRPLGALRYVATASPAFCARWFPGGFDAVRAAVAPGLLFDQHDRLLARWAHAAGIEPAGMPVHRVPSTQGFVDACLAGLGWGLNPLCLVAPHLRAGRLVDLRPGLPVDVPLHWQCARIGRVLLDGLSKTVAAAAARSLVHP